MNKQQFPLSDQLVERVKKGQTKTIDIHSLCATINKLSIVHINTIYLLILHYHKQHSKKKCKIPYKGKLIHGGKGATFTVKNLPDELIQIINEYISYISI